MNEENNLKPNQNIKPEMLIDQHFERQQQNAIRKTIISKPDKREQRYLRSLHCLEKIGKMKDIDITDKNIRKKIQKYEAIAERYLKEKAKFRRRMSLKKRRAKSYKRRPNKKNIKNTQETSCSVRPFNEVTTETSCSLRPFKEVITDPLCLAIVGRSRGYDDSIRCEWPSIESDLMEVVAAYNHTNQNGPIPRYDTSEIHRGFRIIKCMDEFSKDFMFTCLHRIYEKWKDLKLRLIPAAELPKSRKYNRAVAEESLTNSSIYIRPVTKIITDPLCLALAGARRRYDIPIRFEWPSIESDLMDVVTAYNDTNKDGPTPRYDTSEIYRGFRIIKCMDEFSKDFMYRCLNKISGKWKQLKLKLIPAPELSNSMQNKPAIPKDTSTNPSISTQPVSEDKPATPQDTSTNSYTNKRPFTEDITDPLCLALVGERRGCDAPILFEGHGIESDLMELVTAYNLSNRDGPTLSYDTSEIHRGYKIIKCMNEFSKEFIYGSFNKISEKWKDLNLKLIPAKNLSNKRQKPIYVWKERHLSNAPNSNSKLQPQISSTPPRPSWSDQRRTTSKLERLYAEKEKSDIFKQSKVIPHTNKQEHAKNLPNKRQNPIYVWKERHLSNVPNSNSKLQPQISSAPPPPSWSDQTRITSKLERLYAEKGKSDIFKQSKVIPHTNKQEHALIGSPQNFESRHFCMEEPQTSRKSHFSNNSNHVNLLEDMDFRLSETYDSTDERSTSYREHMEMQENPFRRPNFQQETSFRKPILQQDYPQTSRQNIYNDPMSSNNLNFEREFERDLERNQKYSKGWQTFTDYNDSSESNSQETFQNLQQNYGNPYTNPAFSFNNDRQQNFNTSPFGEVNYNELSQESSNFTLNYEPTYKDATFSMDSSRNFKAFPTSNQHHFSEHQTHNFLSSDDDEMPPPPPSFGNFDETSSRARRNRSYWN